MPINRVWFRTGNNSGIILLVVLWITVILSILAIGLGRRTGIDFALTKYAVGKIKADNAAWAGITYVIDRIRADTAEATTSAFDTLYQCAIQLSEEEAPDGIFKNILVGDGHFDVVFDSEDAEGVRQKKYGLTDEERKININAINQQNYKVLSSLITLLGYEEKEAATIASSVVDWHDPDSNVANPPFGAEHNEYMGLATPYHCKNMPFESLEELLLVRGVTPEIFLKVRPYITIYPRDAALLLVNIETAPPIVLKALAYSVAGSPTGTQAEDADSFVEKIITYRRGDDNEDATYDDRRVDFEALGLNEKETTLSLMIRGYTTVVGNYLHANVEGFDPGSGVDSRIEAVINREDLSIISWRRD